MVAVGPDGAAAAEDAVHRPGDADREPLDAAHERLPGVGFDEEMDVVALDRELQHAEIRFRPAAERTADRGEDRAGAQRIGKPRRPQRDVDGMSRLVCGARGVRDAGS